MNVDFVNLSKSTALWMPGGDHKQTPSPPYMEWTQGQEHTRLLGNFPFHDLDLLSQCVCSSELPKNTPHKRQEAR